MINIVRKTITTLPPEICDIIYEYYKLPETPTKCAKIINCFVRNICYDYAGKDDYGPVTFIDGCMEEQIEELESVGFPVNYEMMDEIMERDEYLDTLTYIIRLNARSKNLIEFIANPNVHKLQMVILFNVEYYSRDRKVDDFTHLEYPYWKE
tara:strand:+ start:1204 stop:1659 length:456 start_codon:yes stop_codon:yes gene_type:complete